MFFTDKMAAFLLFLIMAPVCNIYLTTSAEIPCLYPWN